MAGRIVLADAVLFLVFVGLLRLMGERLPLPRPLGPLSAAGGLHFVLALIVLGSFVGWGVAIGAHGRAVLAFAFLDGPSPSEIEACERGRERWVSHGMHHVATDDVDHTVQRLYFGPTDCPSGGRWQEQDGVVYCTEHDPPPASSR